ncbi:MAG: diiron oxygenase [Acidimicrobiia bacterium]
MQNSTTSASTAIASKAAQLVAASERMTLDPFRDVDWSVEIADDRQYHLTPEKLPLFGTPTWDAMTETERRTYSRHECAAVCAAGIWFENKLMQIVLRHLATLPVTDPAHRYLLVEVADECRHSTMFGEYIRKAGTPAYAPETDGSGLDVVDELPGGRAMGYLLILAVEELLDTTNRATMRDDTIHPVSRQIAKLHVMEEARHVSFAKTYLTEVWPTLPEAERVEAAAVAPYAVAYVADLMVNDEVYETLGIAAGGEVARANPVHRARIVGDLAKLTDFLTTLGVIDDEHRGEWVERGLAA